MLATNVSHKIWADVVLTATYLINRMRFRVLNSNTPHTILQNSFPNTRRITSLPFKIFGAGVTSLPFKIFGCIAFVHNHHPNRNKLDSTSIPCIFFIFLGYSANHKGYKCYSPSTKKFYHFMDVTFFGKSAFPPQN